MGAGASGATFEGYFVSSGGKLVETVTTLDVTGGRPGSALHAIFNAAGSTSFDGQIIVCAIAGGLTIDASGSGNSSPSTTPTARLSWSCIRKAR